MTAKIKITIRKLLNADPFMKTCIHIFRKGHVCKGKLEWEHPWIYAEKQINELWSLVPCCRSMNCDVTGDDKLYNRWISLLRASYFSEGQEKHVLEKYPRKDWAHESKRLNEIFADLNEIPEQLKSITIT